MPSNRALIGKEYPAQTHAVTLQEIEQYAAAYDDVNPLFRGKSAVAPPMFAVTAALRDGIRPVVTDSELIGDLSRLLRLLHGEQEIRWHQPIRPADVVSTVAFVKDLQEKSSGELMEVGTRSTNAKGELLNEMTWAFFIREKKKIEGAVRERPRDPTTRVPHGEPAFKVEWKVAPDQSLRYAEASGDGNPIHTDDEVAKLAGLRGKILHGLCTMAFAQRAIIDGFLRGDASKLKRMRVRFTKPVYPGDTLVTQGWVVGEDRHVLAFEVHNQEGAAVLSEGQAEVAS